MSSPEHSPAPTPASSDDIIVGQRHVLAAVAVAISVVILAPIMLSMQHLVSWAADPHGLGLSSWWPYLVPIALDVAAAGCIGMIVVAAWRREAPGTFRVMVWAFASMSAYAQYDYGIAERDAGRAQDSWWAMPAFAILGPLLLELVLHRIRGWARKDTGEQLTGAAGFGSRWIPFVAFWETLAAWATSRREGIPRAADAIQFVRDRDALAGLPAVEALHYAFGALGVVHPHAARQWLFKRGVRVTQADIDTAVEGLPVAPVSSPPHTAGGGGGPLPGGEPFHNYLAEALASAGSARNRMRVAASALAMSGSRITGPSIVSWLEQRGYQVDRSEATKIARETTMQPLQAV